jgi:hypothetical protein
MRYFTIVAVILTFFCPAFAAETLQLGKDGLQQVTKGDMQPGSKQQDGYLSAVSEIKRLVYEGKTGAVINAINKFKKDYPDIAGADVDTFLQAEIYFSKGNFTKSGLLFEKFMINYSHSELSGFYDVVLERQFAIATAFLAGEKKTVLLFFRIKGYAEGETMMEKIAQRAGDAPISKRALEAVATSYEKRHEYEDAYKKWSIVAYKWPDEPIGKDAVLSMARCKHAAYKGPKYDASYLTSSNSYYKEYIDKMGKQSQPVQEYKLENRMSQITEQKAYKEFQIGEFYRKTGNKQAANLYYQMVRDEWPQSTAAKYAEDVMNYQITEETKNEK